MKAFCRRAITSFVLLAMTASPLLAASTVKLAFESRVEWVPRPWTGSANLPPLPFMIELGDVIRGTVEFDPELPASPIDGLQPYSIAIQVPGFSLATHLFEAIVMDDRLNDGSICDCAYSGPVSPDPHIMIGDQFASPLLPAIDDRIELTRYVGIPGRDDSVPGAPGWFWQPAISLVGSTGVLHEDNRLPVDPATWNAFAAKELRIGIVGTLYGDVPGLGWQIVGWETFIGRGAISSFVAVPEPAGMLVLTMIAASWRRLAGRRGTAALEYSRNE